MVIPEIEASMRESDNVHDHDRRITLIEVSSANASLIANPSHHQHAESAGSLHTPNSEKFEDAATKLQEWEQEPQPNETLDIQKPNKNSKCDLRKSLAWDSAFFTSAGVLDPEELDSIIEGAQKDEKRALPLLSGIEEEVRESRESVTTLQSDSLTVESLESDLFEDVRASIQKSSRVSNTATANSKALSTGGDSSAKVGMASRNKVKVPSCKSPSTGMLGTGKMTKKNPILSQLPLKPVATRGEPSVLKQPKVLGVGKSSPSSTISSSRTLLGDLHIKSEKDKAQRMIGGKVSSVSNAPVIRSSRGIVPKSTQLSKSPSGPSIAPKTKSTSSKSPGVNSSGNVNKSPLNSLKGKADGETKKQLSSCSTVGKPSKIASRDKTGSSNSSLSSFLSVKKRTSSISPASSVSDWSSESSTSMAKYRSNSSRASLDSSSSRKQLSEADARQGSNSQNSESDSRLGRKETQDTEFISQWVRTAAARMVLPPAPMKPSGLRLPSPKIGFFDGVKSSVHTPQRKAQQQSVIPRGLPKHGARSVSLSEGQNNAKLGKVQPSRSVMSIENKRFSNQQTSHPIPLHKSSDVAIKTSNDLQNVKSSSMVPMEVQKKTPLKTGAGNFKVIKSSTRSMDMRASSTNEKLKSSEYVESISSSKVAEECLLYDHSNFPKDEGPTLINHDISKHTSDMGSTENKEILHISTDKMSLEGNSVMHSHNGATIANADHNPSVSSVTENLENTSASHVVEKAPIFCQLDLINNLHPLISNQHKPHHDDQVDCLSRRVGLMDINLEAQKKFKGDPRQLPR